MGQREGGDIGVEMIEKFYGRHLKNNIDASAVNVRKARLKPVVRKKAAALAE